MTDLSAIGIVAIAVVALFFFLRPRKSSPPPVIPPVVPPVANHPPVALPPFVVGQLDWGNQITVDFRYREHGCESSTGEPLLVSGAIDPDGDPLEHYIEVEGPTKSGSMKNYAVFGVTKDSGGKTKRIDREWVTFPWAEYTTISGRKIAENEAIAAIVIGNEKANPGFPVSVKCGTPTPPPVTVVPENLGQMTIRYKVRDRSGVVAESLTRLMVTKGGCS